MPQFPSEYRPNILGRNKQTNKAFNPINSPLCFSTLTKFLRIRKTVAQSFVAQSICKLSMVSDVFLSTDLKDKYIKFFEEKYESSVPSADTQILLQISLQVSIHSVP